MNVHEMEAHSLARLLYTPRVSDVSDANGLCIDSVTAGFDSDMDQNRSASTLSS